MESTLVGAVRHYLLLLPWTKPRMILHFAPDGKKIIVMPVKGVTRLTSGMYKKGLVRADRIENGTLGGVNSHVKGIIHTPVTAVDRIACSLGRERTPVKNIFYEGEDQYVVAKLPDYLL